MHNQEDIKLEMIINIKKKITEKEKELLEQMKLVSTYNGTTDGSYELAYDSFVNPVINEITNLETLLNTLNDN